MKQLEGMMLMPLLLAAGLTVGATLAIGQTQSSPLQTQSKASSKAATASPDRGQQVFAQNCSRCHSAPEGFPPSISGTVAMHMRVRANLSEADYKALRRFLNP